MKLNKDNLIKTLDKIEYDPSGKFGSCIEDFELNNKTLKFMFIEYDLQKIVNRSYDYNQTSVFGEFERLLRNPSKGVALPACTYNCDHPELGKICIILYSKYIKQCNSFLATISHELGHQFLNHAEIDCKTVGNIKCLPKSKEIEADDFAFELSGVRPDVLNIMRTHCDKAAKIFKFNLFTRLFLKVINTKIVYKIVRL